MTSCCSPQSQMETMKPLLTCPQDGSAGHAVQLITLKSLLHPSALVLLDSQATYAFCSSVDCPVVYFSIVGQRFTTHDLKVPVFQKDLGRDVPVCYCFGWSRQRIEDVVQRQNGQPLLEIKAQVLAQRCGCEVNNPQGRCCLINVQGFLEQTQQ